jgi:hypothetical protein
VRPVPRTAGPGDLTTANLPAIALTPAAGNAITFDSGSRTVQIPD